MSVLRSRMRSWRSWKPAQTTGTGSCSSWSRRPGSGSGRSWGSAIPGTLIIRTIPSGCGSGMTMRITPGRRTPSTGGAASAMTPSTSCSTIWRNTGSSCSARTSCSSISPGRQPDSRWRLEAFTTCLDGWRKRPGYR